MSAVRFRPKPPFLYDIYKSFNRSSGVAVNMPACHAGDRGFDPRLDRHIIEYYNGKLFGAYFLYFKSAIRWAKKMIDYISRKFVKDYENYAAPKVRGRYGVLSSVVSIVLNVVMAGFKIFLGFITNSIAITADGFNNLSDVAANVATLLGFIFSLKNPDKEHPFGHGRIEYLAGLSIAVLILFVGLQMLWDSVWHIINPEAVYFSWLAVIVLVVSIFVKFLMGKFNFVIGSRIDSATLIAAGRDSRVDILATFVTLFALFFSIWTDFPIDGVLGAVVSLIILKTGYDILKDTVTFLLGAAPDERLLEGIRSFTAAYERVLGTHDLMIHDYGPGQKYLTMHVEVNKNEEMEVIHDVIDEIERDIYRKFNVKTTIHLDPVDLDNDLTIKMKGVVEAIVSKINDDYSIHDFRIRHFSGEKMLIFDVTIPADDTYLHRELTKEIEKRVRLYDPTFTTRIQIDHSYT